MSQKEISVQKLKVLNDFILVKGYKPTKRAGVVVGISTDDKPEVGEVIQVGPGRFTDNGEFIKNTIKIGDLVLFNQHTTTKFNLGGELFYTLREVDVIGYQ